ncbi:MAG TPA: ACP S-malonyltransferase [Solirubrobacteraceae bacterium]|nr:ACP S-malonyltransferase [Solirubrobacteraceae bacterium]
MNSVTDNIAVVFPGQGSQTPEMRDLVAQRAPDLLERCIELVGEDPFARVEESTRFQQPAIFCASIAGWQGIADDVQPGAAAGHSLGELAALAAAGVLTVDAALELVVLRGRLMAEADARGSMIALVGADAEEAAEVADAAGLTVANDNAPGQIVLAGDRDKFDRAEAVASELGKRTIRLPVAGAFHSPSMAPAVAPFRAALDEVELDEPRFTVFSCASARPFTDPRDELARALIRPVRWRETFTALHDAGARAGGVRFIEVGPGKVLARLAKRIVPGTKVETTTAPSSAKPAVHA